MNEDRDILVFPENIDFSAVCRCCLGSDSLRPIFPNSGAHKPYSSAILITMGVKVQKDDGLPQQMCAHCIYYLNNSMSFRKTCKDAEATLLQAKNKSDLHLEVKIEKDNDDDNTIDMKSEELNPTLDLNDAIKLEIDIGEEAIETKRLKLSTEVEDTKRVHCIVCNKELSVKSWNSHMRLRHPGADERRIKCELCHKNIVKEKINRHVGMMHGLNSYQCEYCNSVYQSRNSLVQHIKANCVARKRKKLITEKSREMVECEVCHKSMQRASLKTHRNVQHAGLGPVCECCGLKPTLPQHCGRRFGNRLRLAEHLRAKHGHEKFRCSNCDFTCSSTIALENHERRHRGEKPFVCEACGAEFHAAYLLAQHRKSHSAERTVQCSSCPKLFKTSNSLSAHRRAVHGAARHRCAVCARAYSCRHYAVKHMRTVHLFKGPIPPLQVLPESNEL